MSQKGFPEMAAEAYNRVRFVKRRDSSENNPGELILDEEYRLVGWMDGWMDGWMNGWLVW